MRQDSVSIERFYKSPLGAAAGRLLAARILDLWPDTKGLRLLGLGFAMPVLAPFAATARCCVAALPEGTGHLRWSATGRGNATVVAPEARLPFGDGLFDRALLLHALEEAERPRILLRELWRVMAPEGRIVVAAANRLGLWTRADRTPFGHGRPWTRRQLSALLSDGLFQVTASAHALYMPPVATGLVTAAAEGWERAGSWLTPGLGGVVLIEAVKRLYAEPGGGAVAPTLAAIKARKGKAALPRDRADEAGPGRRSGRDLTDETPSA